MVHKDEPLGHLAAAAVYAEILIGIAAPFAEPRRHRSTRCARVFIKTPPFGKALPMSAWFSGVGQMPWVVWRWSVTTQTYRVLGLTCGECLAGILDSVRALSGVQAVAVNLVGGGRARLRVAARHALDTETVRRAVEGAGFFMDVASSHRAAPTAGDEAAGSSRPLGSPGDRCHPAGVDALRVAAGQPL